VAQAAGGKKSEKISKGEERALILGFLNFIKLSANCFSSLQGQSLIDP
jgi:hypothetical protein